MIHKGEHVSTTQPPVVDYQVDGTVPLVTLDFSPCLAVLPLLARAVNRTTDLQFWWEQLNRYGLSHPEAVTMLLRDDHVRDALTITFSTEDADELLDLMEDATGRANVEAHETIMEQRDPRT